MSNIKQYYINYNKHQIPSKIAITKIMQIIN